MHRTHSVASKEFRAPHLGHFRRNNDGTLTPVRTAITATITIKYTVLAMLVGHGTRKAMALFQLRTCSVLIIHQDSSGASVKVSRDYLE